jgi:Trk K+ transport system NAD-binding subunit
MKYLGSHFAYFLSQGEVRRNIGALLKYLALLGAVVVVFSVLFHVIMLNVEGREHSWITGLYWTLTVMSTLGFGDITFTSDVGRLFSVVVLLSGIVLLLVMLPFVFIRFFYAPWLESRIRMRAPRRVPPDVTGHVIVTHWDTITPGLLARLDFLGIRGFVVEANPEVASRLHAEGVPVVAGEVDSPDTYAAMRAADARLVFANGADTVNTNITLTVREVAPSVPVAALVTSHDSIDVLELTGATHVLPLTNRLGEQLANRVNAGHARTHPIGRFHGLQIVEFPVHNTPFADRTIADTRLREETGVSIVAVWEGGRLLPADPTLRLSQSSVPVVVGTDEQIAELNELLVIYDANYEPVLVLGGGRVGRAAARALRRDGLRVHLIERRPELLGRIGDAADRVFIGDAADHAVLLEAGIAKAPSVLLTTHDDDTNVYLAVYCRRLNPDLRIVSRITHDRNIDAVVRAGADFVLSYASLGVDSVLSLLRGDEPVVLGEAAELYHVTAGRRLAGRTLVESEIGARTGMSVIAVQRDGTVDTRLGPDFRFAATDELLVLGSHEQRRALRELLN